MEQFIEALVNAHTEENYKTFYKLARQIQSSEMLVEVMKQAKVYLPMTINNHIVGMFSVKDDYSMFLQQLTMAMYSRIEEMERPNA